MSHSPLTGVTGGFGGTPAVRLGGQGKKSKWKDSGGSEKRYWHRDGVLPAIKTAADGEVAIHNLPYWRSVIIWWLELLVQKYTVRAWTKKQWKWSLNEVEACQNTEAERACRCFWAPQMFSASDKLLSEMRSRSERGKGIYTHMAKRKRASEANKHNTREAALGKKAIGIHTSQSCGTVSHASETVMAERKKERERVLKHYHRLGTWKLSKPDSQLLS